ncbi:MAG: hypothetical protein AAGI01_02060 [Myxococcota bacterium]
MSALQGNSKRRRIWVLGLCASLVVCGCKSREGGGEDFTPESKLDATPAGVPPGQTGSPADALPSTGAGSYPAIFPIGAMTAVPPKVSPPEGAPSEKAVAAALSEALGATGKVSFAEHQGDGALGVLTYLARIIEEEGAPRQALVLVGVEFAPPVGIPNDPAWVYGLTLVRELRDEPPGPGERILGDAPVTSVEALVDEVIGELAGSIAEDVTIRHAADDALAGLMRPSGALLQEPAAMSALRRVARIPGAPMDDAVRAYLAHESPKVVSVAAAMVVARDDRTAGPAMVDAATTLSANRHFEAFVSVLTLMGDIGGEEVRQYLQAVSEGHSIQEVREVAAETLTRARRRR